MRGSDSPSFIHFNFTAIVFLSSDLVLYFLLGISGSLNSFNEITHEISKQKLSGSFLFEANECKMFHFIPFEFGTSKCPVFKCLQYLNVLYSDPHYIYVTELMLDRTTSVPKSVLRLFAG